MILYSNFNFFECLLRKKYKSTHLKHYLIEVIFKIISNLIYLTLVLFHSLKLHYLNHSSPSPPFPPSLFCRLSISPFVFLHCWFKASMSGITQWLNNLNSERHLKNVQNFRKVPQVPQSYCRAPMICKLHSLA